MNTWIDDTRGRVTLLVLALGTVLMLGLVAGFPPDMPQGEVLPAHAASTCGVTFGRTCAGGDTTFTSAVDVTHVVDEGGGSLTPVEPGATETFTVTAYYETTDDLQGGVPAACQCNQASTSVTASVSWSGSSWSVSCTGCNSLNGPIYQLSICGDDDETCTYGEATHSSGYKLLVDAAQTWSNYRCPVDSGLYPRYLDRVTYTASSIPSGSEIDMQNCSLGNSVTWTNSQDGATDYGGFECSFDCNASGPDLVLYYE